MAEARKRRIKRGGVEQLGSPNSDHKLSPFLRSRLSHAPPQKSRIVFELRYTSHQISRGRALSGQGAGSVMWQGLGVGSWGAGMSIYSWQHAVCIAHKQGKKISLTFYAA
jgi:hypothetical protein